MKRFNRIFCLLLATMMLAGLLAGCEFSQDASKEVLPEFEAYYKAPEDENIVQTEYGTLYINNELLITVDPYTRSNDVERLADKYDGEIVGYISFSGDYQIKLPKAYSVEDLNSKIEEIKKNDIVIDCTLNYGSEETEMTFNDPWTNTEGNKSINGYDGNWWAEAVNAYSVWDEYTKNMDAFSSVKIGIFDTSFDTRQTDLQDKFKKTWENPTYLSEYYSHMHDNNDENMSEYGHGTHVSGLIGAKLDNGSGIAGVCQSSELYGYSYEEDNSSANVNDLFQIKYAIALMLNENVKIINFSNGFSYRNMVASLKSEEYDKVNKCFEKYGIDISNYVKEANEVLNNFNKSLETFLLSAVSADYDFLICKSAGNQSGKYIGYDETKKELIYDADKKCSKRYEVKYAYAYYDDLSGIENAEIKDRIIVVGASDIDGTASSFTDVGDRVDVYAPGVAVLSALPNNEYEFWPGTSMSTPIVAGIAGNVWSLNPDLSAKEVKEIVCKSVSNTPDNFDINYVTPGKSKVPIVNAYSAFTNAKSSTASADNNSPYVNTSSAIVIVTDNSILDGYKYAADADVRIIDENDKEIGSAQTDYNGSCEFFLSDGTYTVEVTGNGDTKTETFIVAGNAQIVNITLNESTLTSFSVPDSMVMTIGELGVIEPDVKPSDANGHSFKWTTSDDSIVQIASDRGEKCILTAKGKGTATVTAEATINGKTVSHSTEVRVASQARDTVLVLDVSGSMGGTPLEEMKKAAIHFCEELLTDEYNNRVGLVLYDNDIEKYDLTNDIAALEAYINDIDDGGMTNMEGGISYAVEMLDSLSTDDSIKNIVIMADGLPNKGNTSKSGSMPISDSYSSYSEDISYANAVIDTAQSAMSKYKLYSLGFFHDLYGEEKDFAVALMQSLTNMTDGYHEVDQAENLQFAFGDISEEISDGSKIVINIACPVDVSVSYQGETLSSSQGNYNDKTSFGSLQLLGKNQDVKVVSVDADKVYDIELNGTDEGSMDYSVNYFDDNESLVDSRSFSEIPITDTTTISSSTENSAEVSLNIDSDGDGVYDIIYSATQNGIGNVTWQSEPTTEATTELTTVYTEPSTEVLSTNNSLETWQIILLVLGIAVTIGVVIITVVLVVTKEKTDNFYDLPVTPDVSNSKPNTDNQREAFETKPLTGNSATISILSGSMKDKEFTINSGENILIGKKPGLTQLLLSNDYEKVSRIHCTVSYSEKLEKFFVTDSSRNGTYYENHTRLVKGKRTAIDPGSIILLADDNCRILLK